MAKLDSYLKVIRPKHWTKNFLIFTPLIIQDSFSDLNSWLISLYAFIGFGLIAACGYIINDLFDIKSDRLHARKKTRPIAAGKISPSLAYVISAALLLAGFSIGYFLVPSILIHLATYLTLSILYSVTLKKLPILDIVLMASFYFIRVYAGAQAIEMESNGTFLKFFMFLFLSLALLKRYSEAINKVDDTPISGTGYSIRDIPTLRGFGMGSGVVALLALTDINLWSLAVIFIWQMYLWIQCERKILQQDPIIYSLRNIPSLAALILLIILAQLPI